MRRSISTHTTITTLVTVGDVVEALIQAKILPEGFNPDRYGYTLFEVNADAGANEDMLAKFTHETQSEEGEED